MAVTISVVRLTVSHLPMAVHFYRDGLGLEPTSRGVGWVSFQTGGVLLQLIPRSSRVPGPPGIAGREGLDGIVLACRVPSRAEVDRILVDAIDAGGTLLRPAVGGPDDAYVGTFADLDGYRWDVVRWTVDEVPIGSEDRQTVARRSASALR